MSHTDDGTAYDLSGPDRAPVVVLIHGLGLTRESTWGGIAPRLAARFRILSYDLCGHGETALPNSPVTLKRLSDQLVALMDALKIPQAALVGFSLGGMINRRCAMDHPRRVSSIAVLNSPHERGEAQQARVEMQARAAGAGGPEATIDAALARWFTEDFHHDEADTVARIRAVVLANDSGNYAAHRLVLAEGVKELIRPAPPLALPALVMTCAQDSGSTPDMSRAIASEISGAELRIVAGLRHLGLIEKPEVFADAIEDFLNGQPSG